MTKAALLTAVAIALMSSSSNATSSASGRGPWGLALLPGMGLVTWSCAADSAEPRRYALGFRTEGQTATETLELRAGGHAVLIRRFNPGVRIRLPHLPYEKQRLIVRQHTEPGVLRAVIDVDFSPRPVSPSHCYPYLPPAVIVRIYPR